MNQLDLFCRFLEEVVVQLTAAVAFYDYCSTVWSEKVSVL